MMGTACFGKDITPATALVNRSIAALTQFRES
jgi:hypothetical protein